MRGTAPRAVCPVCKRDVAVMSDGRIGRHMAAKGQVWPTDVCPAWGTRAVDGPVDNEEGQ